jgi:diacylglycerol kinase family enzyme
MIFPSLFKGEHLKHTKYTEVLCGHDITVEFDSPTPLQIDGETILGVSAYRAYHKAEANTKKKVGNEVSGQ